MTPEERAKVILGNDAFEGEDVLPALFRARIIVLCWAICHAENDALDRAAESLESQKMKRPPDNSFEEGTQTALQDAIDAIKELKHK